MEYCVESLREVSKYHMGAAGLVKAPCLLTTGVGFDRSGFCESHVGRN